MVVADFYDVDTGNGFSARMQRLSPIIDSLVEADAELIEKTARRLGQASQKAKSRLQVNERSRHAGWVGGRNDLIEHRSAVDRGH